MPSRWSSSSTARIAGAMQAILEEHGFALELAGAEIPVVAPLLREGRTLLEFSALSLCRVPDGAMASGPSSPPATIGCGWGDSSAGCMQLGRRAALQHRPLLSIATYGDEARETVLRGGFLPDYLIDRYAQVTGAPDRAGARGGTREPRALSGIASTATAIAATFCGGRKARISSTSTTA